MAAALQPTPAPSRVEGLWGCCTLVLQMLCSNTTTVSHMLLLLQLFWCYCTEPTPTLLPMEGQCFSNPNPIAHSQPLPRYK